MRMPILLLALVAMATLATGEPVAPDQIQPLLLGAEIPAATILDLDGNETSLGDAVAGGPTLVVFFRGGW